MEEINIEISEIKAKLQKIDFLLVKPFGNWSEEEKTTFQTRERLIQTQERLFNFQRQLLRKETELLRFKNQEMELLLIKERAKQSLHRFSQANLCSCAAFLYS
jgi:hypothetical protein